jgi:broad specificity phosphatase PhoE
MTVFFVRHGESVANINDTVAGSRDDCPLTERGAKDAYDAAYNLSELLSSRGIAIDRLISSPLQRAKMTADIISTTAFNNMPVEIDERFIERDVGAATGMKHGTWYHLEDDPTAGVETRTDLVSRAGGAIDSLRQQDQNIVVVSHNGFYRAMRTYLEKKDPKHFFQIDSLGNGVVYEVPRQGGDDD